MAPNRLGRCFQVDAPNRVWVSDITYIRLQQGWVYLAVFIDLFSRQVVGWALSKSLDHGLVLKALERARRNRKPQRGLMIHSDRGIQYACTGFRQYLKQYDWIQSMWSQLLSAPFAVREKTKVNRYISFVYSPAPRRGAYEGVYSVDPIPKV